MSRPMLYIGSLQIPWVAGLDMQQSYEPLDAIHNSRLADGTLDTAVRWSGKMRTRITGSGWIPPGLSTLNRADDYVIKCIAPDSIGSPSNVITLPAARRTDAGADPYGIAIVNGEEVPAPVTGIVGDVATLTVVSGATLYQCWYYPQITARLIELPREYLANDASWPWSIVAEQT